MNAPTGGPGFDSPAALWAGLGPHNNDNTKADSRHNGTRSGVMSCPRCGSEYMYPVSHNNATHPDPLVETWECTTCGAEKDVVID